MKIIDANSGREVKVGAEFENINGRHQLLAVQERLLSAEATFVTVDEEGVQLVMVPLQVRWTHPSFFLQKVGFIPS